MSGDVKHDEAVVWRFRAAEEVGRLKGGADVAALHPRREAEIVRRASEAARAAGGAGAPADA